MRTEKRFKIKVGVVVGELMRRPAESEKKNNQPEASKGRQPTTYVAALVVGLFVDHLWGHVDGRAHARLRHARAAGELLGHAEVPELGVALLRALELLCSATVVPHAAVHRATRGCPPSPPHLPRRRHGGR